MPFTRKTITAEAGYTLHYSECDRCAYKLHAPDTARGRSALAIAEIAHTVAAISSCPAVAERRKAAERARLQNLKLLLA